MELYILDTLLRRAVLYESYISLIWTERYNEDGDFEIVAGDSRDVRNLFPYGTLLALKGSTAVMRVETTVAGTDDEGTATYTIKGRSLESILRQRYVYPSLSGMEDSTSIEMTGTPRDICQQLFDGSVGDGGVSLGDKIPFYVPGNLLPSGNIPFPAEAITKDISLSDLYSPISSICQEYNMGFRFVRTSDDGVLAWELYMGNDRTISQTALAPVLFSTKMDTLTNINELTSVAEYYNVAYVVAKHGSLIVYADGVDETISGFERSVMVVDATDIELEAGTELNTTLFRKGKEALAEQRIIIAVDGEIPQVSTYVYGVDYGLGDLVALTTGNGGSTNMRVTEQIFMSDDEGTRAYPTLALDKLITPGSWMAWSALQVWNDAIGEWGEV